MKQIISKDGKVVCVRTTPYPPEIIKQMKKAGYKVKEEADDAGSNQTDKATAGRKGRKRKGTDPVGE